MEHPDAAQVASLVGAAGAVLVLVFRSRVLLLAGLAVLAAAEAGLAWALVPGHDLHRAVASPTRVAALAAGLLVLAAGAVALARRPAFTLVALLAVAPFRVPIHLGDQRAFLLVPLYAVLAAAGLALAYRAVRERDLPGLPRELSYPAAFFIGLSAVSLVWSEDLHTGTIELLFFLLPFAALVAVLGRSPFRQWHPRALAATLVGLACVFAGIGLWQQWSGRLFFAPDLQVANAYTTYFRVTSLFKDPNLYGRALVLAISVLLVALWLGRLRLWLGVGLIAFLWAGLYFSYSQSSMAALAVAVLALSLVAADRRHRLALVAGVVVFAAAAAGLLAANVHGHSLNRLTSGRSALVSTTTSVFQEHPGVGVGVGGQPTASRAEGGKRETEKNASHTTPLTVAAELGVVGLLAYAALLAGASRVLLAAYRVRPALGLALAGCFLLLIVHSLFYSGFFEDPVTWGSLAVAAASLGTRPAEAREEERREQPTVAVGSAQPVGGGWQT